MPVYISRWLGHLPQISCRLDGEGLSDVLPLSVAADGLALVDGSEE